MKVLLALITISMSVSAAASDCLKRETQVFSSKVIETQNKKGACSFKVLVQDMRAHIYCPLSSEKIESTFIKDRFCRFKVGDSFDGILVDRDQSFLVID